MNKHPLLTKLNKIEPAGIPMHLRLYLFFFVLVLTMSGGIIVILLVTGTFTAGITESRNLIRSELNHSSQEISMQFGQLSSQAVEFSKELSLKIEENLKEQNIPFSGLSDNPENIEYLITDLFENTFFSLQKTKCSGVFFILDTTINTSLNDSQLSKAGLYIKNMEPNVISSSSPSFTILRGISSIGRENSIDLHTQWRMEFDVRDADYFYLPMEAAHKNPDIDISKLYYWKGPLILPGTSEEVMVCSVPLIDKKDNVYGVCGFEISSMLFKLSHMPSNDIYSRMFCMLAPLKDSSIPISRSLFAGGYSVKDISEEYISLKVMENGSSFSTYTGNNGTIYLGLHTKLLLYPSGSPYPDEGWIAAMLVPKEDISDSITQLNIILICLLSLLVTIGIIISIIISNNYLKPISQGIEIIKSEARDEAPRTNVQEIDELISYLAFYKKELNKKVENDKYKLSMLEQFVGKTKTLSPAEHSVFNFYIKGLNSKEIADAMFLSINTIKTHSKHIFAKLEVTSREELLLYINMLKEIGFELK